MESRLMCSAPAYTYSRILRRSRRFLNENGLPSGFRNATSGLRQYLKISSDVDSNVRCAYESSAGLNAFVVSNDRPPIPAAPRRIVFATLMSLFAGVYNPDSSKNAAEIG